MGNVILINALKMPLLGFGNYLLQNGLACEQSVLDSLNIGYRLIDTAATYNNEKSVGRAIKKQCQKGINFRNHKIFTSGYRT